MIRFIFSSAACSRWWRWPILSVVVFVLARATGDPLHMILPMSATEEDYANARRYLGLDRPYVEQYLVVRRPGRHRAISAPRSARGGR